MSPCVLVDTLGDEEILVGSNWDVVGTHLQKGLFYMYYYVFVGERVAASGERLIKSCRRSPCTGLEIWFKLHERFWMGELYSL